MSNFRITNRLYEILLFSHQYHLKKYFLAIHITLGLIKKFLKALHKKGPVCQKNSTFVTIKLKKELWLVLVDVTFPRQPRTPIDNQNSLDLLLLPSYLSPPKTHYYVYLESKTFKSLNRCYGWVLLCNPSREQTYFRNAALST